jgi:predicted phage terminase large subunit-like protein
MEFPTLRSKAIELKAQHGADYVLIEDKSSGTQLLQELRASRHYWARGVQPSGDKRERLEGQTILFQKRRVFVPEDAPWLDGYLHELLSFPDGKHDDQVDSTSQALSDYYRREETPAIIIWAEQRLSEINPAKAAELKTGRSNRY